MRSGVSPPEERAATFSIMGAFAGVVLGAGVERGHRVLIQLKQCLDSDLLSSTRPFRQGRPV